MVESIRKLVIKTALLVGLAATVQACPLPFNECRSNLDCDQPKVEICCYGKCEDLSKDPKEPTYLEIGDDGKPYCPFSGYNSQKKPVE